MTPNSIDRTSPLVIGCNGGSGSRVVAQIAAELGIYMGLQDKQTLDNIWFPSFFYEGIEYFFENLKPRPDKIVEALKLFENLMFSPFESLESMIEARTKWFGFMLNMQGQHINYVFKSPRFQQIYRFKSSDILSEADYSQWGWKEPISHFYIRHLKEYFPNMKYIHLIRNGLDMAYTRNVMHYWLLAKYYGVPIPQNKRFLPKAFLNVWIRTNLKTIEECTEFLKDRFLVIKFEDLCINPVEQIRRLVAFLNIDCSDAKLLKLAKIVKPPKTIERYKSKDLSIFSQEEIKVLSKFGY